MKFFISKTEDWKEMDVAIEESLDYLKEFNITIESKHVNFDVTNPLYYHTTYSWSWLQRVPTYSLHGGVIRMLGEEHGGKDHDYYGIIVDKNKSIETNSLHGQHSGSFKTVEVYARKSKTKKYGFSPTGYTLIHEILHAMANHYGFQDTLHMFLTNEKDSLDGYIEYVRNQIKPKVVEAQKVEKDWRWTYFKPTERTGSFGTVADLKPELLDMLNKAREYAGIPFVITSGYRSVAHNKKIGGATNSAHLRSLAVDLRVRSSNERATILDACKKAGFNRIGIAKTFIHVDCDPSLTQNVVWLY